MRVSCRRDDDEDEEFTLAMEINRRAQREQNRDREKRITKSSWLNKSI